MTRHGVIGISAALAAMLASVPAEAQSRKRIEACAGGAGVTIEQRIAACDRVLRSRRGSAHARAVAHNNRGGALYYSGQPERAVADYDRAIALDPTFAHAYNNRCWSSAVLGRNDQAVEDCTKVLRLYNIANTFENRGFAYLRKGDYERAIADYDAGLRLDPPNKADFLYGRGFARVKKGDAGGNADITAAKAVNPHIAEDFAKYGVK